MSHEVQWTVLYISNTNNDDDDDNNNREFLLSAIIHRPDAPKQCNMYYQNQWPTCINELAALRLAWSDGILKH